MQQTLLLFSRTVLGAGIQSALLGLPEWTVWHAPTQCHEQMVDLAERSRPAVTIFDLTCLRVVDFFQMLGHELERGGTPLQLVPKRVKELFRTTVIVTSSGLTEENLFHLFMWGVAAHMSGNTEPGEIAGLLQRVMHGEYLLSEECLRKAQPPASCPCRAVEITAPLRPRDISPAAALPSPLTGREEAVLRCIAQGMANAEVARTLGIGEGTVRNHITAIFKKLEVRDRTSAVVCALRQKWLEMPEVPHTRRATAAVA